MFVLLIGCLSSTGLAGEWEGTPVKDAMLRGTSHSGLNHGITPQSFVGRAAGTEWVCGIAQWDLPAEINNTYIESATVTYDVYPFGDGDEVGEVLALTQSWLEGTGWGNDDATSGGCSDLTYDGINNWATPFGDTEGIVYDTQPIPASPGTVTFDVTALVQKWADGSLANNGIKLAKTDGDDTFGVWNKESAESVGARLNIVYNPNIKVWQGTPEKDAMLRGSAQSGLNYGAIAHSFVGIDSNDSEWVCGIQQWNLPGDLPGKTVVSATVTYDLYDFAGTVGDVGEILALTQSWVEGSGVGTAPPDGATDLTYDGTHSWETPFGDTEGVVYDSQLITAIPGTLAFDVTAIVQKWADGSLANNGIKIRRAASSGEGYFGVWNREHASGGARLVIYYDCPHSWDSDLDQDCTVDMNDFGLLVADWLADTFSVPGPGCTSYLTADLNEDCIVNTGDFGIMENQWMKVAIIYPGQTFVDFGLNFGSVAGPRAAWLDYDNNEWMDLYAADTLWRNNDGQSFTSLADYGGVAACGDYDNDGYIDMFNPWELDLYRNQSGTGGFSPQSFPSLSVSSSQAACWGDWDADGYIDLYVCGFGGTGAPDSVVMNNQNGSFSATWTQPVPYLPARCATACDFDEDADMDIYVSNYRLEANLLWQNNGTGSAFPFANVAFDYGVAGHYTPGDDYAPPIAYGHTIGSTWGDMDSDGHFDLFVGNFRHNWDDGSQDYAGFYRNRGPGNPNPNDDWHFQLMDQLDGLDWQESFAVPALADYDNDGDLDLYFTTVYSGDNPVLFRNDGNWNFVDVTSEEGLSGLPPTYQAAWADFDNDGDVDLFTAGKLFVNQGNPNSWLKVRLRSNPSTPAVNRFSLGAQARIVLDDGRTVTRQVDGGSGSINQNELTLHFGLDQQTTPVNIEIRWPDGHVQTVSGLSVNQSVSIDLSYSP